METKLLAYKINKVSFNNEFNGHEAIRLLYHVSTNWKKEDDKYILAIGLTVGDDQKITDFSINVDAEGVFEIQGEADKAREQCIRELLYLLRAFITTLTSAVGLPPMVLPVWDIMQDIKKADETKQGE